MRKQVDILQQAAFRLFVAKLTNHSRLAWQLPSAGAQQDWSAPDGWRLLFHEGACSMLRLAEVLVIPNSA
jgi:hypothetical protein